MRTRTFITLSLLLALAAAPAVAQDDPVTLAPPDTGVYVQINDLAQLRKAFADDPLVVLLRDRLPFRRGKEVWQKFYGERNAVNLGIGGDRTQHVIWRLDNGNLEGISPKLAVIMIGTNNSGSNTPEQIADGITAIVDQLKKKTPRTKIL